MKNELATIDCQIYEVGDIVVITNMMPKPHAMIIDRYPIGLITEVTYSNMIGNYPHQTIEITGLRLIKYSYKTKFRISLLRYRQAIRPAMKREEFLYHLEGGPFVLREENEI